MPQLIWIKSVSRYHENPRIIKVQVEDEGPDFNAYVVTEKEDDFLCCDTKDEFEMRQTNCYWIET